MRLCERFKGRCSRTAQPRELKNCAQPAPRFKMEAMLAGALAAEEASAAERPAPPRREGSMGMGSLVATAQAASALQRNATARAVDVDEQANVQLMEDVLERLKLCLLYTSPSPRDRTRSRMPSSA